MTGSATDTPASVLARIPSAAWVWIAVTSVSGLGTGVMQVGLTWSAAGIGGAAAGWISAALTMPTVLLVLFGGAIGDRRGQRQVLLLTTGASVLQYAAFLVLYGLDVPLLALLVGNALASGTIAGFSGPSSTVYVRNLTPPELVPRTVAISGTVSTVVRVAAPALGGVVVGALSLTGALGVNLASFIGVLLALVLITPAYRMSDPELVRTPMVRNVVEGIRSLLANPGLRVLVASLFFVAGSLLTVSGLGLPLLVRARGWAAGDLGVLEACVSAGYLLTASYVAARGPARRPFGVMVAGIALAIVGVLGLALVAWLPACYVAAFALGVGTVAYSANLSPVFIALSPADKLSRYSSILYLAQVLPVLVFGPLIGAAAERWGAPLALVGCTAVAAIAPVLLGTSRAARELRLAPE